MVKNITNDIKDVIITLAKYNKITNLELLEVLREVKPEKLTDNVGSYYNSIMGILNHQLLADINWLRALVSNIPELNFVPSELEKFSSHRSSSNELHWPSLNEYKSARIIVDNLIERVVNSIPSSQYSNVLKIENPRGKLEDMPWRILLHLFNHHTHHRGGIAVLLDQLDIKNDYSNLLWKI